MITNETINHCKVRCYQKKSEAVERQQEKKKKTVKQMVRGNGVTPGETEQQQSRETEHGEVRKEEKSRRGYGQERVTAGSMWPSLRVGVQQRKMKVRSKGQKRRR